MRLIIFISIFHILGIFLNKDFKCNPPISRKCKPLELIFTDSAVVVKEHPIVFFQGKRPYKDNEVFEPLDTLYRDTLVVYGSKYTIDELTLEQTDYSGAYSLHCACILNHKSQIFFVFIFFNAYQMGTEQQANYLLFMKDEKSVVFHASYVENLNFPSSKLRVVKNNEGIFLKSKNIDRLR
jgi:hypothetical protein